MVATDLYADIKNILNEARANAVRAVNFSMVLADWEIGKRILEDGQHGERRAAYGKNILKDLSKTHSADFGEGFSAVSLENYRKIYLVFSNNSISSAVRRKLENQIPSSPGPHALRRELSWTTLTRGCVKGS